MSLVCRGWCPCHDRFNLTTIACVKVFHILSIDGLRPRLIAQAQRITILFIHCNASHHGHVVVNVFIYLGYCSHLRIFTTFVVSSSRSWVSKKPLQLGCGFAQPAIGSWAITSIIMGNMLQLLARYFHSSGQHLLDIRLLISVLTLAMCVSRHSTHCLSTFV